MSTTITAISAQGARRSVPVSAMLSGSLRDDAREETLDWIKRLRLIRYGASSMRQRFTYRDDSLWWFTELYLQKQRRLDAAVATIVALDAVTDGHAPARLLVDTADVTTRQAAAAFGRARGVPIEITGDPKPARGQEWSSYLVGLTATLSRLRSARPPTPARARIAAFVHTAFWRPGAEDDGPERESYIGPVLGALSARVAPSELAYIGVGPRRNFRARRWWDGVTPVSVERPLITPIEQLAPRRALAGAMEFWRRRADLARDVVAGTDVRAAAIIRGCDLWDVLRAELQGAALVQWPWSVRAMDEAGAALDALQPQTVVTYAEAGGWGRALVLEARRRRIGSVGLQHGFIYRHWLNYRHEPDEMVPDGFDRAFPLPDRTLLFDRYAEAYLLAAGHMPARALVVTGSAGRDDLARRVAVIDRDRRPLVRDRLGVAAHEQLLVLVAKFSEIQDELPALVAAISAVPDVRLVIRPHPAETAAVYAPVASSAPRVSIAPADFDLATLVAAADGLVTMNSTVAIDGLVLGVPSLVVGVPNNLSPFVDAGVMLGASGENVAGTLRMFVHDASVRERLLRHAAAFTARYDMRADGAAAERAADAILNLPPPLL